MRILAATGTSARKGDGMEEKQRTLGGSLGLKKSAGDPVPQPLGLVQAQGGILDHLGLEFLWPKWKGLAGTFSG